MVALVAACLLVTASSTLVGVRAAPNGAGDADAPAAAAPAKVDLGSARLTISPRPGSTDARPDLGVVVTATNGTVGNVVVWP
jgi:hypothetical protein